MKLDGGRSAALERIDISEHSYIRPRFLNSTGILIQLDGLGTEEVRATLTSSRRKTFEALQLPTVLFGLGIVLMILPLVGESAFLFIAGMVLAASGVVIGMTMARHTGRKMAIMFDAAGVHLNRIRRTTIKTDDLPYESFEGVICQSDLGGNADNQIAWILLVHSNPGLSIPLYCGAAGSNAVRLANEYAERLGVARLQDMEKWRVRGVEPKAHQKQTLGTKAPSKAVARSVLTEEPDGTAFILPQDLAHRGPVVPLDVLAFTTFSTTLRSKFGFSIVTIIICLLTGAIGMFFVTSSVLSMVTSGNMSLGAVVFMGVGSMFAYFSFTTVFQRFRLMFRHLKLAFGVRDVLVSMVSLFRSTSVTISYKDCDGLRVTSFVGNSVSSNGALLVLELVSHAHQLAIPLYVGWSSEHKDMRSAEYAKKLRLPMLAEREIRIFDEREI